MFRTSNRRTGLAAALLAAALPWLPRAEASSADPTWVPLAAIDPQNGAAFAPQAAAGPDPEAQARAELQAALDLMLAWTGDLPGSAIQPTTANGQGLLGDPGSLLLAGGGIVMLGAFGALRGRNRESGPQQRRPFANALPADGRHGRTPRRAAATSPPPGSAADPSPRRPPPGTGRYGCRPADAHGA